jgi:RNA polymerase sigma-70 factor, ECF subfamily
LGPGNGCQGSKVILTSASGCPAFAQYRVDPQGGHMPWAITVLEVSGGKVAGIHAFLEQGPAAGRLFASFGLPAHLPA